MKQYKLTDDAVDVIVENARNQLTRMEFVCPVTQYQVLETLYMPTESDLKPIPEQFSPGDLVIFRSEVRIVKRVNADSTVLIGQLQRDRFLAHTVPAYCLKPTDHVAQVKDLTDNRSFL